MSRFNADDVLDEESTATSTEQSKTERAITMRLRRSPDDAQLSLVFGPIVRRVSFSLPILLLMASQIVAPKDTARDVLHAQSQRTAAVDAESRRVAAVDCLLEPASARRAWRTRSAVFSTRHSATTVGGAVRRLSVSVHVIFRVYCVCIIIIIIISGTALTSSNNRIQRDRALSATSACRRWLLRLSVGALAAFGVFLRCCERSRHHWH